jgi:two-component system chemotaxis response regulator CheB
VSVASEIKVLVVDDSALMRKVLVDLLTADPRIRIVGTAKDGIEAIELARTRQPDVVTLDVEMPGLSGLDTIPALLAIRPMPIVMVSALTQEGAEVTLEALERGAVDFLPKPDKNQITQLRATREVLIAKVVGAAGSRLGHLPRPAGSTAAPAGAVAEPRSPAASRPRERATAVAAPAVTRCIVLGISTGGPQALTRVIPALRPPLPPILIVQHMPAQFTSVLAARLDRLTSLQVKEAQEGDRVLPDQVLIANGGRHLVLIGRAPLARVSLPDDPPVSGHRPSIDVLFASAARVFRDRAVGLIMTGMGRDGVDGCRRIREAGGLTFGQDEATSTVFGMNKVAAEEGVLSGQFSLEQLPELVERLASE